MKHLPSLFSHVFEGDDFFNRGYTYFAPKSKIIENDTDYSVTVEVPGFNKDNLEILIDDNFLTVDSKGEDKRKLFNLKLNDKVDIDNIGAKTKDGILTLKIPKQSKAQKKVLLIE